MDGSSEYRDRGGAGSHGVQVSNQTLPEQGQPVPRVNPPAPVGPPQAFSYLLSIGLGVPAEEESLLGRYTAVLPFIWEWQISEI